MDFFRNKLWNCTASTFNVECTYNTEKYKKTNNKINLIINNTDSISDSKSERVVV